jgi:hypothetical protein
MRAGEIPVLFTSFQEAEMSHMYASTKTWNPFVGCLHDCTYCGPTFKAQLKRQKRRCQDCYNYKPHIHRDRLKTIPSAKIIFVVGNGDICFCPIQFIREIIDRVKEHNKRCLYKTYYFQSKNPGCFKHFMRDLPDNAILLTTLETNRNKGYRKISKAPLPTARFKDFLKLDYPRKVVTIEPVMDFDLDIFTEWVRQIKPEYVWIGYNSKPKQVSLPEPEPAKMQQFIENLKKFTAVRGKELRNLVSL